LITLSLQVAVAVVEVTTDQVLVLVVTGHLGMVKPLVEVDQAKLH
tara:strand:+ start:42 stop:176 length:135 start_codon:yes stop_codon:yes gene_type:complete